MTDLVLADRAGMAPIEVAGAGQRLFPDYPPVYNLGLDEFFALVHGRAPAAAGCGGRKWRHSRSSTSNSGTGGGAS